MPLWLATIGVRDDTEAGEGADDDAIDGEVAGRAGLQRRGRVAWTTASHRAKPRTGPHARRGRRPSWLGNAVGSTSTTCSGPSRASWRAPAEGASASRERDRMRRVREPLLVCVGRGHARPQARGGDRARARRARARTTVARFRSRGRGPASAQTCAHRSGQPAATVSSSSTKRCSSPSRGGSGRIRREGDLAHQRARAGRRLPRAAEWTEATSRWTEGHPHAVFFPGVCRVHHAWASQTRGDWHLC